MSEADLNTNRLRLQEDLEALEVVSNRKTPTDRANFLLRFQVDPSDQGESL